MKDRIETIIRDWLNTEFHNPDALPGLVLSGLAEEINKHRWEIFNFVQEEYDIEDMISIAEDKEIELTEEEKREILHRYKKIEDSNLDVLSFIIDEVTSERNKQK